ncbi:ribosome maturation factor RimM [Hyphomicrobiales bacterium 4NK60-0047b]
MGDQTGDNSSEHNMSKRIVLGVITNAHGIKGDVTIKPFGQDLNTLTDYGPLTDKTGKQSFTILSLRHSKKDLYVARIKELTDRNMAESAKATDLYIELSKLPEPDDDEFYYHDLIDLRVQLPSGDLYGTVKAVENFGASDIIEILPQNSQKTVYFSFTKEIIPVVNVKEGFITLEPPLEDDVTEEAAQAALKDE